MSDTLKSDLNILKETLGCIHSSDELGYYLTSRFYDGYIRLRIHMIQTKDAGLQSTHKAMSDINQDIWNICTLVSRMEWFRNLAIIDQWAEKNPILWNQFTSLDIEHFYIELRSVLDYIATALSGLAIRPKQTPTSFDDLSKWLVGKNSDDHKKKLGTDGVSIVESASWYPEIRRIRDSILHYGSNAFVFGGPNDGILFQVFHGRNKFIIQEPLMWNENVVDFQLYASLYFARIFILLGRLGDLICSRVPEVKGLSNARNNYRGIDILADWINRLIKKLER